MDKKKLYVGNLPWSMTDVTLKELFTQCGEVTEAIIIMDHYAGRSKGFGFVTFANEADAEKAVAEMNEKEVEDRKIIVNVAKPREERTGGGDFRRDSRRDSRRSY